MSKCAVTTKWHEQTLACEAEIGQHQRMAGDTGGEVDLHYATLHAADGQPFRVSWADPAESAPAINTPSPTPNTETSVPKPDVGPPAPELGSDPTTPLSDQADGS